MSEKKPILDSGSLAERAGVLCAIVLVFAGVYMWGQGFKTVIYGYPAEGGVDFLIGALLILPGYRHLHRVEAAQANPYYGLPRAYASVAAALDEWQSEAGRWPQPVREIKLRELDKLWFELERTERISDDRGAGRQAEIKAHLLQRKHACFLSTP